MFAATTATKRETIPQDVPSAISYYADMYNVSQAKLIQTLKCESGMKQTYDNGYPVLGEHQEIGIAQFQNLTFFHFALKMGLTNPNIQDPIQQIEVMAYVFSIGGQHNWTCYTKLYPNVGNP